MGCGSAYAPAYPTEHGRTDAVRLSHRVRTRDVTYLRWTLIRSVPHPPTFFTPPHAGFAPYTC